LFIAAPHARGDGKIEKEESTRTRRTEHWDERSDWRKRGEGRGE